MRFLIALTISIILCTHSYSQTDFIALDKENYSINYPKNWQLDTSGQMNSEFILFSELEENDIFSENVNLLIQDIKGLNMTLKAFVELSENQIKTMARNSKIYESNTIKNGNNSYHDIVWSGHISNQNLKFKQYFFIKNEKAYVLTFTAHQTTYDAYITIGNQIINSFKLK